MSQLIAIFGGGGGLGDNLPEGRNFGKKGPSVG